MRGEKEFELRKQVVLRALASEEVDKSRKGGVDVQIAELIRRINAHPHFYTTSSCSGRISLFLDQPPSDAFDEDDVFGRKEGRLDPVEEKEKKQKGGDWIYVSHDPAVVSEVLLAMKEKYATIKRRGLLVFRFEPFILALECVSLYASQQLVTCALASGFRESGITNAGKRFIVAVRCSLRMEVPVADEGELLVTEQYLEYLVNLANKKMVLNHQRIDRFLSTFIATLASEKGTSRASVQFTIDGRKTVKKKRQTMSGKVAEKLLSSLERRQSGILSRISLLEQKRHPSLSSSTKVLRPASTSETSSGECTARISLNSVVETQPEQGNRSHHNSMVCELLDL